MLGGVLTLTVVVISVAWIGYEMWFKVSDAFNEKWETDWITAAFWHGPTTPVHIISLTSCPCNRSGQSIPLSSSQVKL